MKYRETIACLICLVHAFSCSAQKPQSYGKPTEIITIIDDKLWTEVEPELSEALQTAVFTIGREPIFEYVNIDPSHKKVKELRKWKYVVVIGSLESSELISANIPAELKEKIVPEHGFLYVKDDVWARKQTALFFVAETDADIRRVVKSNASALFTKLDEVFTEYQKIRMFASGVNESLRLDLAQRHGFSITLPNIYKRVSENEQSLRFRARNPTRSFVIYWEEKQRDDVTEYDVLGLRQAIADVYYPGDTIVADRTRISSQDFNDHPAIHLRGVWENEEQVAGGVFHSYAFNCPETNRFFMIDGMLYAPEKRSKYAYVIQIEEILKSFQCGADPEAIRAS